MRGLINTAKKMQLPETSSNLDPTSRLIPESLSDARAIPVEWQTRSLQRNSHLSTILHSLFCRNECESNDTCFSLQFGLAAGRSDWLDRGRATEISRGIQPRDWVRAGARWFEQVLDLAWKRWVTGEYPERQGGNSSHHLRDII